MPEIDADVQALLGQEQGEEITLPSTAGIDADVQALFPSEVATPSPQLDVSDTLERGARTLGSNLASFLGESGVADRIAAAGPQAQFPNFRELSSASDVGAFIGERTLESLPQTGVSLLGGVAGGFATGGPIGAIIGAGLATLPAMIGESRTEVRHGGGEGSLAEGLPAGAANTALELFPVTKIAKALGLNKLMKDTAQEVLEEAPEVTASLLKEATDGLKTVGEIALTEGAVESLQTLNNKFNERFFNNKEVLALNAEDREELLQSFVGGLAGGTGMGGVAVTTGAALDKLGAFKKELGVGDDAQPISAKAKQAQALSEKIRQKLKDLDAAENVIAETAERFDETEEVPPMFTELQSDVAARINPIPRKSDTEGPRSSIIGHHNKGIRDMNQKELLRDVPVRQGIDADGQAIYRPMGEQVDSRKGKENSVFISSFVDQIFDEGTLKATELETALHEFVSNTVADLGLKDFHLTIVDEHAFDAHTDRQGEIDGSMGAYFRGPEMGSVIALNAAEHANNTLSPNHAKAQIFETLSHELGHAIVNHQWSEIEGDRTAPKSTVYRGLIQEYREWLRDVDGMTANEFFKKYDGPTTFALRRGLGRFNDQTSMREFLNKFADPAKRGQYLLSFDEYTAQQMSRLMSERAGKGKIDMSPESRAFWQQMLDRLKEIYQKVKGELSPGTTFEAWVNSMFLREELSRLREDLAQLGTPQAEVAGATKEVAEEVETASEEDVLSTELGAPVEQSFMGNLARRFGLEESGEQLDEHSGVVMNFLKFAKVLTPLQLAELARKTGITEPQQYMKLVREFANTKMKQIEKADTISQAWRKLGKTKSVQLGNVLFAISDRSDALGRRLTAEELEEEFARHKLDAPAIGMWREIDGSFSEVLENIERGLVLDAASSFIEDPERARAFRDVYMVLSDDGSRLDVIEDFTGIPAVPDLTAPGDLVANPLKTELDRIHQSVAQLRQRNYFPRTRLGQYTISIKAQRDGQVWEEHEGKKGDTLGFYSYESKKERDAQLKAMTPEAVSQGLAIVGSKMDSKVFAMMGMPEALIQRIVADGSMDLTEKQKAMLKDISLNLSPGKKFLKNLKKRRGVAGFSDDALRVYANYMMSAGNHLARVEHSKSLLKVLQRMDTKIAEAVKSGSGQVLDDLVDMKDYFREHFDYLMKPDNDWAQLRAIGFLWYLGFNVKSALVNLTQIPLVTFPVMAGRFGDKKSVKHISRAYGDVSGWLMGKEGKLSAEEEQVLQTFREAGIIDESMVMELAGLGEGDVLKRSIPGWDLDNTLSKVSYYGGAMFRLGEKYNRLVTAIAGYRAAIEAGETVAQATETSREMIEKSQFEYAKWNRPEFMRGKKSVIFLFWQYIQHASFLFAGGAGAKTAARMWLLALLISGVEGLPFWNTLTAILDFGGTQAKKAMGSANPRVALEEDLRELLLEINDQPDSILRGMSSFWGLGPLHLASLLGAPMPEVDVQGSLGFGSPIPFLDELFVGESDADKEFGKFVAGVSGPVGGMVYQAYKQINSTDPNVWKRVEKALPVFAKNAVQGSRWLVEDRETFRGEGTFAKMELPEQRVSAVLKALGFTPTRLTQKYKQVIAQQEATLFWTTRRQLLLEDYAYARTIDDREAKADALNAIKKHNTAIRANKELRGMGITGGDMNKSLKARQRSIALKERGIAQSRRQRSLGKDIQRLFPSE